MRNNKNGQIFKKMYASETMRKFNQVWERNNKLKLHDKVLQ